MSDAGSMQDNSKFWRIFCRVVGRSVEPADYTPKDIAEWDSLRHVELMFELEEHYDIDINPEQIVALYSSTDTILEFLRAHKGG
jgi:acyl carrier protein